MLLLYFLAVFWFCLFYLIGLGAGLLSTCFFYISDRNKTFFFLGIHFIIQWALFITRSLGPNFVVSGILLCQYKTLKSNFISLGPELIVCYISLYQVSKSVNPLKTSPEYNSGWGLWEMRVIAKSIRLQRVRSFYCIELFSLYTI